MIRRMKISLTWQWAVVVFACVIDSSRGAEGRPLMRDFVGINGHTVQFRPALYQPVCRLVRDYHPVQWDLDKNTSELPPFPFAKNRVDWSNVYGSWVAKGFEVDVCLMFDPIKPAQWQNLEG